jgi:hypothetical protein
VTKALRGRKLDPERTGSKRNTMITVRINKQRDLDLHGKFGSLCHKQNTSMNAVILNFMRYCARKGEVPVMFAPETPQQNTATKNAKNQDQANTF